MLEKTDIFGRRLTYFVETHISLGDSHMLEESHLFLRHIFYETHIFGGDIFFRRLMCWRRLTYLGEDSHILRRHIFWRRLIFLNTLRRGKKPLTFFIGS